MSEFREREFGKTRFGKTRFGKSGSANGAIRNELMTPGSLLLGNAGQSFEVATSTPPATGASRFSLRRNISSESRPMRA